MDLTVARPSDVAVILSASTRGQDGSCFLSMYIRWLPYKGMCFHPFDIRLTVFRVQSQNEIQVEPSRNVMEEQKRDTSKQQLDSNDKNHKSCAETWQQKVLLLKQADRLSDRAYCWFISGLHRAACPLLSPSLCGVTAPSKTVSKLLFKYLWKQLTEQCQGSSRWLMRRRDWTSHTMEAQRDIWSRHCRTGGAAERWKTRRRKRTKCSEAAGKWNRPLPDGEVWE